MPNRQRKVVITNLSATTIVVELTSLRGKYTVAPHSTVVPEDEIHRSSVFRGVIKDKQGKVLRKIDWAYESLYEHDDGRTITVTYSDADRN
jgi:hypothetical protein